MIEFKNMFSEKEVETDLFHAFDRIIHQSFYVIDCKKKEFLQISENNTFFCNQPSLDIKKMNLQFYQECIPKREQPLLNKLFKAGSVFFEKSSIGNKKNYVFKSNLHLKNGKEEMLVCHTVTPLKLSENGAVELLLCMASLPLNKEVGYFEVYDGTKYWHYDFKRDKWEYVNSLEFTYPLAELKY